MLIVSRPLPRTRSHARRDYTLVGSTLTIRQGWADCERYTLDEDHATGARGRVFLLLKDSDGEVYEVFLAHDGPAADCCTCQGARMRQGPSCKHRDALRDLLEHGDLPHPWEGMGAGESEPDYFA